MNKREKNIFNQISLDLIKIFLVVILNFFVRDHLLCQHRALCIPITSHMSHTKVLLVFHQSGTIIFISQMFDGFFYLRKCFWNEGDSVIADRGFLIEDDLKHYGVKLNIPPAFLKGCDQLTSAEVKESKTIASVRIHVERAIQRLETF